jgi:hypothetical protein
MANGKWKAESVRIGIICSFDVPLILIDNYKKLYYIKLIISDLTPFFKILHFPEASMTG